MDVQTLGWVLLVAGLGLLAASAVGLSLCLRRDKPVPPPDVPTGGPAPRNLAWGWQVCWRVRVWFGLLTLSFVILILAAAALLAALGEDEPNVFILEPETGDVVAQHTLVRGTYQNLGAGEQIWVIVAPHDDGAYYPQSEVVVLEDDEAWSVRAVIGEAASAGETHDLLAVLADPEASALLKAHMTPAESDTLGPALRDLPEGVRIYEHYTVVRQ